MKFFQLIHYVYVCMIIFFYYSLLETASARGHNTGLFIVMLILVGFVWLDAYMAHQREHNPNNRLLRAITKIWICFAVFVIGIALLASIGATLWLWYFGIKQFGENTGVAIYAFVVSGGTFGCAYAMLLNIRNNLDFWR